jgi:hypothetical protein
MEKTSNSLTVTSGAIATANSQSMTMTKVTEMLFEQMEKLRGNPGEIPIADCMCGIAGRIIDSTKVQLQATELMLKASGTI